MEEILLFTGFPPSKVMHVLFLHPQYHYHFGWDDHYLQPTLLPRILSITIDIAIMIMDGASMYIYIYINIHTRYAYGTTTDLDCLQ